MPGYGVNNSFAPQWDSHEHVHVSRGQLEGVVCTSECTCTWMGSNWNGQVGAVMVRVVGAHYIHCQLRLWEVDIDMIQQGA